MEGGGVAVLLQGAAFGQRLLPGGEARRQVARQAVELQLHGRPAQVFDELPGQGLVARALEDAEAGAAGDRGAKACLGSGPGSSAVLQLSASSGGMRRLNSPMFQGPDR